MYAHLAQAMSEELTPRHSPADIGKTDMDKRKAWMEAVRVTDPVTGRLSQYYYPPGKLPTYTNGLKDKPSEPSGRDRSSCVSLASEGEDTPPYHNYDPACDPNLGKPTSDSDSDYEPDGSCQSTKDDVATNIMTRKSDVAAVARHKTKSKGSPKNKRLSSDNKVSTFKELIEKELSDWEKEETESPRFTATDGIYPREPPGVNELSNESKVAWELGLMARKWDYLVKIKSNNASKKKIMKESIYKAHSRTLTFLREKTPGEIFENRDLLDLVKY
jgi:hypothetical protein